LSKNLIIVESPAKAQTIERYLGKEYKVAASMGHVRDLPKSKLGVDVDDGIQPKYITIRGKGKILDDLRKKSRSAEHVFLATDPDREGEAIAWHLCHALKLSEEDSVRIAFNEITEEAVQGSLESPRSIDRHLVDAQQARRVLDRLVGYKLSPWLWRKVRRGLSAGRVQSAAVKMVVDREREREAFEPEEYWTLDVQFAPHGERGEEKEFLAALAKYRGEKPEIPDEKSMDALLQELPRNGHRILEIKRKEAKRYPGAAFNTSSLQQAAARQLRMNASFAMRVAQELYEGLPLGGDSERTGLITYMRTDATRVSQSAVDRAREFVISTYGQKFSEPRTRRGRGRKDAEEAHEAIRPTDVALTPEKIKGNLSNVQYRLYRLIWQRFVASQMKPAIYDEMTVSVGAAEFEFAAKGRRMKFPGFRIIYGGAGDKDKLLPEMSEGDEVDLLDLVPKQNFTKPPARYTEASLVKALEDERIGRPSTYAPIVETIQKRNYVGVEDGGFYPTELGRVVNDLLEEHFPEIVDLSFTAEMEDELDSIEGGEVNWQEIITEFWDSFADELEKAEEAPRVKLPEQVTDEICEECGENMVVRFGRFGKFLACPAYPDCKNSKPYFEKTGALCPQCGGDIVKKSSRKGKTFYGCLNYPDCEFVVWHEPSEEECPECGTFMVKRRTKRKGEFLQCGRKECRVEVAPAEDLDSAEAR